MNNDKAIALLRRMQEPEAYEPQITEEAFEALGMAIKALEQADHFAETDKKATQPVITCDGCRFVGTYDTDFPCCSCVRREKDYYEPER